MTCLYHNVLSAEQKQLDALDATLAACQDGM